MLIESIEIAGVGPFREAIAVGPLAPGLNILAQPNEWGKSTIIHALCRALFEKYSSQSEEIRQLRPAGTSLSPRIEVCFTARGDRHRLVKKFLEGRSSELHRWNGGAWERTDESDKADQRVRELLGAPALEGRLAKPGTWGLIQYLWCRQDEPAQWPCWEGDGGETTRRRLATVEIDTTMRWLALRLEALGETHFTAKGAVKKGSPLQLAEAERETAEAQLAELRRRGADLEQLDAQYAAMTAELPRLERERGERAAEASALRTQAEAAELIKGEIALAASEFQRADAALQSVRHDRDTLAQTAAEIAAEEAAQGQSRQRAEESQALTRRLEERVEEARAAARRREEERTKRQTKLARIREILQSRKRAERLAGLLITQAQLGRSAREVEECEARLAARPALSKNDLQRARELERAAAEQSAQLRAAGLSVRLEPVHDALISPAADGALAPDLEVAGGASRKLLVARTLTLELHGWGRVIIESGAQETAQLLNEVLGTATQLAALLAQTGAASLAEAETAAQEAQQWQARLAIARAEVAALLTKWKTPAGFAADLAKAQAEHEQSRRLHQFTAEEEKRSEISLQVEEQALAAAEAADRKEEKSFAQGLDTLREELETARVQAAEAAQKAAVSAGRTKMLREQTAALLARHPAGLEDALADAQREFTRAEARLATARRDLPPQAESLAERATRAARAAAEVEAELQRKQRAADRLKTLLEERGGDGLYARVAEAEERLETAQSLAGRLRREGLAARLVRELIQRREESSIRAVLSPLEDRLTQTFAALTGIPGRRVWFDEHLAVKGVGPRPEELIAFENLSRGAREQMLLALRVAIALQVAADDGPQCLVLDDVLVHTDATRHENVLDFLQSLSSQVQIVLLTCHGERYRGLGHVVPVVGK
ncbi:MAG TPA: hypothetical protein VGO11_02180 [Chthoniobacteraceae bacterium]|nr:hypothetical protein [Chthoniobacteraceae bacterium]